MSQAKAGDVVSVHYTGSLTDGTVFDSSNERDPLELELGSGMVIEGFDEALVGMKVGEKKTVKIPVAKAYGEHNPDMVMQFDRDQFPPEIDPVIGQKIELNHESGQTIIVVVTEVGAKKVTLDANPPLAGKDLIFDLEVMAIN
ncbi:MAG: peptidylprolyl isomerase [Proteobacteria bacterium]|nr:peptidylprolyl isomerase [Pseudomonadota bacterium]MBU1716311.1 peptidylprolyl isomerase [Pseudomonadota bacterium]